MNQSTFVSHLGTILKGGHTNAVRELTNNFHLPNQLSNITYLETVSWGVFYLVEKKISGYKKEYEKSSLVKMFSPIVVAPIMMIQMYGGEI